MCVWFSHDIDFRTWNTVILGGLWGLCNLNRYMRNGSYSHTSYDNCPIWMDGELNRRVGGFLTHGHMTRCLQTRVLRNIPPTHEHCKFHAANEGTVPCRVIWKSHLITVKKKHHHHHRHHHHHDHHHHRHHHHHTRLTKVTMQELPSSA